ncbi:hypothetical protein UR09_00485 [Candidatus Nitromaritima sp. SCGC AAA799-A02]|nr:hypothetical protein UR09_00485 [Candidatus Nitromaritima sp. SCGC AAA799-A02]
MKNKKFDRKLFCRRNFRPFNILRNQDGVVLVTALVLLLMLALLAAVAVQWAATDTKRSKQYIKTRAAFYLAEAGIQRALSFFNYDSSGNSPGEVDDGFDDEIDNTNWPAGTFSNIALGSGTYTVTVADNDDNDSDTTDDVDYSVVLTSTGTQGTNTVTIEAVIFRPLYQSKHALLTEGEMKVTGTGTTVTGSAHTNANFGQSGSPIVTGGVTATGTCAGDQCSASGAPTEDVPTPDPTAFEAYADYIFNADGTIDQRNSDGTITTGVQGNSIFSGFSHNSQGWSVGNNQTIGTDVPNQAFLYFKDDFKAGSIGSSGTPWEITIITEKSIAWTGNAYITNWKDSSHSEDIQNVFLVAENDIKINSMDQNTMGLIACKDQMTVGGGASFTGSMIAKNLGTTDNTVQGDALKVHGGITIVYDNNLIAPFLSNKVTVLTWQEM